jgi:hypothetical protein
MLTNINYVRHMLTCTGTVVSLLVVALQWLVVMGFISHSYTWWLKADDPVITAGFFGTILFSIGSALAVAFSLWSFDQLYKEKAPLKFLSLFTSIAGLSGLLVYFGMVVFGYVVIVHR